MPALPKDYPSRLIMDIIPDEIVQDFENGYIFESIHDIDDIIYSRTPDTPGYIETLKKGVLYNFLIYYPNLSTKQLVFELYNRIQINKEYLRLSGLKTDISVFDGFLVSQKNFFDEWMKLDYRYLLAIDYSKIRIANSS